jgi:hypothetical protein
MYKTTNKKILFGKNKYEIFWVTDFVLHIIRREKEDSVHIGLKEIETFADKCIFFDWNDNITLGLGKYNGEYYQIVSYIVDVPHKRCVIKTCHRANDINIIKFCKENKL